MAKVDTNAVRLAFAREVVAGTRAAAGWRTLEPNEITNFGATIVATPREPISDQLQRRKGSITDLDAAAAFTSDLTFDGFLNWIEAVVFSTFQNANVRDIAAIGVAANGYTLAANTLDADAIAKFLSAAGWDTLVWADGFSLDSNNGLHLVSAAATAASVNAAGTIAAAGDAGFVSLAGVRVDGGLDWAWDALNRRATLTKAGLGTALQAANMLHVGQMVHIGSVASIGADVVNGLQAGAIGYARFVESTADTLVFDRVDTTLQMDVAVGAALDVDICFTDFVENVSRNDAAYQQIPHSLELTAPDLIAIGVDGYEYARGAVVGTMTLDMPLTAKATMAVAFVAEDADEPSDMRAVGSDLALRPRRTQLLNTSDDFARLRMTDIDDDGITSDFKALTITINPQVSAEKVLGQLGARFINRGNLLCDITAQVIFSNREVPAAIRRNRTVRFDTIVANDDGVIVIDLPSQTLSGGGREYPANQAVLLNTTGQSFEDDDFGNSIMVSIMVVPIPS